MIQARLRFGIGIRRIWDGYRIRKRNKGLWQSVIGVWCEYAAGWVMGYLSARSQPLSVSLAGLVRYGKRLCERDARRATNRHRGTSRAGGYRGPKEIRPWQLNFQVFRERLPAVMMPSSQSARRARLRSRVKATRIRFNLVRVRWCFPHYAHRDRESNSEMDHCVFLPPRAPVGRVRRGCAELLMHGSD